MSNVEVNKSASRDGKIPLHGSEAFAAMRKAGRLAAEPLDMLVPIVQPGVTTAEIDELILAFALDHGAIPATLNYRGYRYSTCTSVNHVVCHGMPNDKPLRDGRHRQHRRHADRRRLAWRHQPHVSRSARFRAGPSV